MDRNLQGIADKAIDVSNDETIEIVDGMPQQGKKPDIETIVLDDRKIRFEAKKDEEFIQVGKFQIHRGNMQQAIDQIERSLESDYLFVDEIGILEMNRGGYYPVLGKAFSRKESCYQS